MRETAITLPSLRRGIHSTPLITFPLPLVVLHTSFMITITLPPYGTLVDPSIAPCLPFALPSTRESPLSIRKLHFTSNQFESKFTFNSTRVKPDPIRIQVNINPNPSRSNLTHYNPTRPFPFDSTQFNATPLDLAEKNRCNSDLHSHFKSQFDFLQNSCLSVRQPFRTRHSRIATQLYYSTRLIRSEHSSKTQRNLKTGRTTSLNMWEVMWKHYSNC